MSTPPNPSVSSSATHSPALRRWLKLVVRLIAGAGLMAWIFHAIFMFEAQQAVKMGKIPEDQWEAMSRVERWQVAWTRGPTQLVNTAAQVEPAALGLSLLVMGAILLVGIARWRMVLRAQGLHLPWSRAIEIGLVSHFFNSFLLGSTGGDVMRAIYTARETHHKKTEAVVTVFADRILGVWALLLFGCAMMVPQFSLIQVHRNLRLSCWAVLALTVVCSGVVLVALRGGISRGWQGARAFLRKLPAGPALEKSLDACRQFGREPLFVTRVFGFSMVLNLLCVLHVQVLANGLRMSLDPWLTALIVPVITVLIAFPITPNGIGLRENLFVYLLWCPPVLTVAPASAFSLSLLAYGGSLAWSLVGGVCYLTFRKKHHLAELAARAQS